MPCYLNRSITAAFYVRTQLERLAIWDYDERLHVVFHLWHRYLSELDDLAQSRLRRSKCQRQFQNEERNTFDCDDAWMTRLILRIVLIDPSAKQPDDLEGFLFESINEKRKCYNLQYKDDVDPTTTSCCFLLPVLSQSLPTPFFQSLKHAHTYSVPEFQVQRVLECSQVWVMLVLYMIPETAATERAGSRDSLHVVMSKTPAASAATKASAALEEREEVAQARKLPSGDLIGCHA